MKRIGFALGHGSLAAALLLGQRRTAGRPGRRRGLLDPRRVGRPRPRPAASSTAGDSITFRTDAIWDRAQVSGLESLPRSTGCATRSRSTTAAAASAPPATGPRNHPDPAFDRDDDDGDGRWEEAEIIAGAMAPEAGRTYTSLVQFSRWHGKRVKGALRVGLGPPAGPGRASSRSCLASLLGEWQAERYTLTYDTAAYPRVGHTAGAARRCGHGRAAGTQRPGVNQEGFVVTFSRPLRWSELTGLISVGSGKWTAFEAVGSSRRRDDLLWTCGGPVERRRAAERRAGRWACAPDGISAAVGLLRRSCAGPAARAPPMSPPSRRLQDTLTGLLFDVGGFGVEPPGLTVNDRYWELVLAD